MGPSADERQVGEDSGGASVFVPTRLAARLGAEGESEAHFTGTVLVADVTGYAQLVERHAAAGGEGIERLAASLDDAFRSALAIVESHGGEAVYFAGDALVAYWDAAGPDGLGQEPHAIACARALVEPGSSAVGWDGPPLSFHIGLASGPLWAARVGGWSGRWDLIFGGRGVRAAFAGLRLVGPGQVHIQRVPALEAPGAGEVADARGEPAIAHRDLVPASVERRAGTGEWAAEVRKVDCLFVRLEDIDESRPGELARFRRALFLVHDTLSTASATGRLVIDDHGLTIVWVIGEPAGEAARAADAPIELAVALSDRLRRAGFTLSAGMASGRAFCGTFGSDRRREIVAVGTPMVLAARLMERARGSLLVAGAVAMRRGSSVRTRALTPLELKGFSHPIPVAVAEPSEAREPADALVGREAQLAALDDRLEALAAGRGGICFISGPAGVGKSALVRALEARALRRGLPFAKGEAHGSERSVPYFAWRRVFRAAFADLTFDEPARLGAELARLVAETGHDPGHVPLLGPVFPARVPDEDQTRAIVGDDRARATRELMLSLLAARLPAGQVVVLEDLHDMDSTSLGLLDAAVRRLPGVLFVVTSRFAAAGEVAERIHKLAEPAIELPPLVPADVARLAGAVLGMEISDAVAAEVCARAHGNPLYVFAYLRSAREAARAQAGALDAPIAALPAGVAELDADPNPVRGVLGRCLDGLSALESRAIKCASVVGERFSSELLGEALEASVSPDDLDAILRAAVGLGIVRIDPVAREFHQFAHALIQQSCYETIPVGQRRQLHGRVASALEKRLGPVEDAAPDELLVDLAHHHGSAAHHERTVHFAEQAALRVRRQGAYREAIRLLDRCLDHAAALPAAAVAPSERVRWLRLKAEAAGAVGDRDARRRDAEAAILQANVRPPRARLPRLALALARLLANAARRPGAIVPRREPRADGANLELAQVYRQLAIDAYFTGRPTEIVYYAGCALEHARLAGRSPELSDALASMGTCLGLVGFVRAGRRHLAAAANLSTELASDPAIIYAHLSNALFLVGLGEWGATAASIDRCQQTCTRAGNAGDWGNAQALRFWLHHYRGDLPAAEAAARSLRDAGRAAENPQHQSWAARFLALCHIRRDEWSAAADQLKVSRDLFALATENRRLVRPLYELVPVLGDSAAANFMLGARAEAREIYSGALASFLAARRPAGHAVLEGYVSLARIAFACAREGGARADLGEVRRIVDLLRRYRRVFPIGEPQRRLWEGRLAALRGRSRAARAHWLAGVESARRLGMAHDAALLTEALG